MNVEDIRKATPDEILEKTGYKCGGVPALGYEAKYLINPKVMEIDYVYTGGSSEYSLLKIFTKDIQKLNKGQIIRIRK